MLPYFPSSLPLIISSFIAPLQGTLAPSGTYEQREDLLQFQAHAPKLCNCVEQWCSASSDATSQSTGGAGLLTDGSGECQRRAAATGSFHPTLQAHICETARTKRGHGHSVFLGLITPSSSANHSQRAMLPHPCGVRCPC